MVDITIGGTGSFQASESEAEATAVIIEIKFINSGSEENLKLAVKFLIPRMVNKDIARELGQRIADAISNFDPRDNKLQ